MAENGSWVGAQLLESGQCRGGSRTSGPGRGEGDTGSELPDPWPGIIPLDPNTPKRRAFGGELSAFGKGVCAPVTPYVLNLPAYCHY